MHGDVRLGKKAIWRQMKSESLLATKELEVLFTRDAVNSEVRSGREGGKVT